MKFRKLARGKREIIVRLSFGWLRLGISSPVLHRCVYDLSFDVGNSLDIRFHVLRVQNERRNLHLDQTEINRGAKDNWSKRRNSLKRSRDFCSSRHNNFYLDSKVFRNFYPQLIFLIYIYISIQAIRRGSLYKRVIINSVRSIPFRGVIVADSLSGRPWPVVPLVTLGNGRLESNLRRIQKWP